MTGQSVSHQESAGAFYVLGAKKSLHCFSSGKKQTHIPIELMREQHTSVQVFCRSCVASGGPYYHSCPKDNLVLPCLVLNSVITFDSVQSAQRAKASLNGADIYSGCCTLKIEYAKVQLQNTAVLHRLNGCGGHRTTQCNAFLN